MPSFLCPRCGRKFKTNTSLLQHINQPSSSCLTHYEERINFASALQTGPITAELSEPQSTSDKNNDIAQDPFEPPSLMDTAEDTPSALPHPSSSRNLREEPNPFRINYHPTSGKCYGRGETFMDQFDKDGFADSRAKGQLYYPFASRDEWELASFLLQSNLSMASIDSFLKLELVKEIGLSFRTSKDLRNRAEILPKGPLWKSRLCNTVFPTKQKLFLYYRDAIDCLQSIIHNPLVQDYIQFHPFQLFQSAEGAMRVYTEWLSGDTAWELQDCLPQGATILGTVLSSDKTNISAMTGNRLAHPLLISLANLNMDFRMKSSNHAFLLLALLPIPSFIHRNKRLRGMLADRLIHQCLNFILEPLKVAARIGIMMSDPLGWRRFCFTPLAAYIVDTPESTLMAAVAGKTSSVTMASYKQFGDDFRHEPRTASITLAHLHAVAVKADDPWNLEAYFKAALEYRLNGVHEPFWADWPMSDPSVFLTPEPLHHWHKAFWDHDAKWCINTVGAAELDFRFSVLHPHVGFRHFKEGISSLKQVTGREHREVQRYIVAIIVGAVPPNFLIAIRALMDFRYLAQSMQIDEKMCAKIDAALKEFHAYKESIIAAGARQGKGHAVIDNWYIPKLEFLQSVVPSIRANGIALQWSADGTERAHIEVIKDPSAFINNQNYESQICRHLDRAEKCRQFNLSTAVRDAGIDFGARFSTTPSDEDDDDDSASVASDESTIETTADLLKKINSVSAKSLRSKADYFTQASDLKNGPPSGRIPPTPFRTFCSPEAAFHLNRDPSYKAMSVDDVAVLFDIPDLREALADYIQRIAETNDGYIRTIGGRRSAPQGSALPFTNLKVWKKFRLQNKSYHYPHKTLPSMTINACHPSGEWELGQYDPVIANIDPTFSWPQSGLEGHQVIELRLIFCIIPEMNKFQKDCFLTYARRFDIVPQINKSISGSSTARGPYPEPKSTLYILKRAKRANGELIGDILPLQQVKAAVNLIPCFGNEANRRFTKYNSSSYSSEFWLNKYFDKELYLAFS